MYMQSRRWQRIMSSGMLLVALSACGGTAVPEAATPATESDSAKQALVIYSGRSEALITPIIEAFQQAHPEISVNVKSGKNNELAAAILEEQQNPQADVFISTDMLTHINLSASGALAKEPIAGTENIPSALKAPDGSWSSITARARVIMYNTELVSAEEAPQSIFDLTDPKWKGKVAAANSTNGAMQAQVAMMMNTVGEEATKAWLDGLVANETTFFGGHTDVRKAVGAGEFAIGLVNHYYYELQKREASDNKVAVVYPDQGADQIGVMVNTTAVGIIAGSPHASAAKTFVEFLFLPSTQQLFAELNYEYPLIEGVTVAEGVTPLESVRTLDVDMPSIARDVPAAIQLMQGAGIP